MSSKNFETHLYIKHYSNNVIEQLITFGVSCFTIKSIDNWQYENEMQIDRLAEIEQFVNNGKIVMVEGKYKDLNCGCYISKLADDCYEFDVWVPTKINGDLDNERISENNSYIYDTVIDMVKKLVPSHELICCVSGIEMLVEYSEDLDTMLDNSSGILQMICPLNTTLNNPSLSAKQDGNYMIVRLDMGDL